jgi:hypothetical protein
MPSNYKKPIATSASSSGTFINATNISSSSSDSGSSTTDVDDESYCGTPDDCIVVHASQLVDCTVPEDDCTLSASALSLSGSADDMCACCRNVKSVGPAPITDDRVWPPSDAEVNYLNIKQTVARSQ